jgi:hypothetical protein
VFFGPNRAKTVRPLRAAFRTAFPDVAAVLGALKRKDYRASSWLLQNAEATLCVGRITSRIMQERPGIALFTVHDSWMCLPDDAPYVTGIIREEFGRYGVRPLVRGKI